MTLPTLHRLTIVEVRNEANDAISVRLAVPPALREAYRFNAGQFLTLAATVAGVALRRPYSICSSPAEYEASGELRVGIRRVAGGRFSNWANDGLRAGSEIDVMTPDGRFGIEFSSPGRRHYLGLAGGAGITPMLSLIKTALETEPDSRFALVYGNRSVGSIMFLEEIAGLKNRWLERLSLFHALSEEANEIELLSGLLDRERIGRLLQGAIKVASIDWAFICGPAPMMHAAEVALAAAGLARDRIRIERFASPEATAGETAAATRSGPVGNAPPVPRWVSASPRAPASVAGQLSPSTGAPTTAPARSKPPAAIARVTLVVDGVARSIAVLPGGASILDTALAAGIGLPYACKAGVCCTCRARVLEGEVRMDRQFSLEQQELDRGFVLSCQSHPVSAEVRLSYDER